VAPSSWILAMIDNSHPLPPRRLHKVDLLDRISYVFLTNLIGYERIPIEAVKLSKHDSVKQGVGVAKEKVRRLKTVSARIPTWHGVRSKGSKGPIKTKPNARDKFGSGLCVLSLRCAASRSLR